MDWISAIVIVLTVVASLVIRARWVRFLTVPLLLATFLVLLDSAGAISRQLVSTRRAEGSVNAEYRQGVLDMWQATAKKRDKRLLLVVVGLGILALMPPRGGPRPEAGPASSQKEEVGH